MNDILDDAVRRAVAEDFGDTAVVSSWVLIASVEQDTGDTAYGLLTAPNMRRHECMGLLAVGKDDLL